MWYYAKDGEQGGPVSPEELQGMLGDGRLAAEALVWKEDMAEWKPASEVPELKVGGSVPGAVGATAPPPAQAVAGSSGLDPVSTMQPQQPAPGIPYSAPPATNGMAVASLVLGIVSFVLGTLAVTGIPAVICGHIARRQIRDNPLSQTGDGLAIGGLVTGYLSIVLSIVVVVFFVGLFFWASNQMPSSSPSVPPSPVTYPGSP